jgi:hypothetical protein
MHLSALAAAVAYWSPLTTVTGYTPLTVLGAGMLAPDGVQISRAHEPSLLFIPPARGSSPNGTLLVVSGGDPPKGHTPAGGTLVLRSSEDNGASWSKLRFPFLPFSDPATVGDFFQNQVLWDAEAKTAHILVGNVTDGPGGCDGGQNLDGMLHISSSDRGQTWSKASPLALPNSPTTCLAPTSGHGTRLTQGPHKGRLLFMGVHNAYHGDVVAYSDDHGNTFESSGALHQEGLDEGSIASLSNGSLITIFRNCFGPCVCFCLPCSAPPHAAV